MVPSNTRSPKAEALFRERYHGSSNVMTPRIFARRMIATGHLAVELSNGDFMDGQIWAVTVLFAHNVHDLNAHDLNKAFSTRDEAEDYIETLRVWRPAESFA